MVTRLYCDVTQRDFFPIAVRVSVTECVHVFGPLGTRLDLYDRKTWKTHPSKWQSTVFLLMHEMHKSVRERK